MIIEVVAGEVGEDGAFKSHAVYAQLIKPVARHLHRHIFRALAGKVVQQGLHRHRIRRGVGALLQAAPKAVAHGANNGGFIAEQIAGLRQPLAHRSFTIGAGDAPHIEAV